MALQKTATHTITVTVEDSTIHVTPDTLVMTSADEVQWAGANARQFSIEFEKSSPFAERLLSHSLATSKRRPASCGRFKYTIVSTANPGVRLDPVIIVEDPPTP